jgi:hypothetical protein
MDASGEIGTPIEYGRLLAHGTALPGFFIEGGFSGAPLLDETSNAVIGMAAGAGAGRGLRKRLGGRAGPVGRRVAGRAATARIRSGRAVVAAARQGSGPR